MSGAYLQQYISVGGKATSGDINEEQIYIRSRDHHAVIVVLRMSIVFIAVAVHLLIFLWFRVIVCGAHFDVSIGLV